MRNSKTCPKCNAADIVRIPMSRRTGGYNWIFTGTFSWGARSVVGITRYLCGSCGYTEEWIDSAADIARVKERYSSPSTS